LQFRLMRCRFSDRLLRRSYGIGLLVSVSGPEGTQESTTHIHSIALSPRIRQVWPRFFASPTLLGSMALQRRATVLSCSVCYSAGATDHSLASCARRKGRFAKQSSMPLPPSRILSLLSSR